MERTLTPQQPRSLQLQIQINGYTLIADVSKAKNPPSDFITYKRSSLSRNFETDDCDHP